MKLRVRTPSHRLDIQAGAADMIEEIARIHGYDRIPATLLADQLPEQLGNRSLEVKATWHDNQDLWIEADDIFPTVVGAVATVRVEWLNSTCQLDELRHPVRG